MTLKQQTINGLTWSFIDNFANQGIQFIIGIILARLLSPAEFGIIGMITVFIAISQVFIDSGFSQALIRKKDCGPDDYCTVFYFNIAIGIIFYFLLFASAGAISRFFNESQLLPVIRVLGLILIINSFGLIQLTILTKNINFKLQTKISIIASITSGVVGICMAYTGWGVWSLVWKTLTLQLLITLLLWLWINWKPQALFSYLSLRNLFSFGSKLLVSGLIDTAYRNIYYLIIGKFFAAEQLGFYTRAEQFKNLPSQNITAVIQRVSYPVLSIIQDDTQNLKNTYKKLIKCTMFISFVFMLGLASIAKPLIITLIGQKWIPVVPYLQLLCFSGMLYPLHSINLNMLNVKGRSDLFLKLEIIKKIMAIPIIIIGILWGIRIMLIGIIVISIIAYFLNSYYSGKMVNYPVKEQLLDIMPSLVMAFLMGVIIFFVGFFLPLQPLYILCIQIISGAIIIIVGAEWLKMDEYLEIKKIVIENHRQIITRWKK